MAQQSIPTVANCSKSLLDPHAFILVAMNHSIIGAGFLSRFGLLVDLKHKSWLIQQLSYRSMLVRFELTHQLWSILLSTMVRARSWRNSLHSKLNYNLPLKHSGVHHIVTTGHLPVSKHMVELGIYQPSTSPVSCPLHIKKKILNGDHGDYRRLKTVTPPDGYPVLYIQNFSMHLYGCKIFSKIDLIRAHHFIPVALEDVHKTDITTPFGLFDFEWFRLCFSLHRWHTS